MGMSENLGINRLLVLDMIQIRNAKKNAPHISHSPRFTLWKGPNSNASWQVLSDGTGKLESFRDDDCDWI